MASSTSQEKTTEKYFNIIEKALQDTIDNENRKSLLREYKDILLEEIKIQTDNENTLQENLSKASTVGDSTLMIKCVKLQETVQDSEKYIDQLKDEIDNVTIQSIADRDTLKIENAEKEQQVTSHYETEVAKLRKQLKDDQKEHEKIEQEIKNQITLEIETKNARLGEIRGNLHGQIVERNTVLIKMQNEHKELRKELNLLKAQEKLNSKQDRNINPKPSNVMEFDEFLLQKTDVPNISSPQCNLFSNNPHELNNNPHEFNNDCNELNNVNNICKPIIRPTLSEYSTTETENLEYNEFANSFCTLATYTNLDQQNISNYNFNHNQNVNSNISNNEHVSSKLAHTTPSTSVSNGNNSHKRNRLTNEEMTYFAEEYDQFNEAQSNFITDIDTVNSKILELVPNPWSTAKMTENATISRNRKPDSPSTLKKCKVEAQSSSTRTASSLKLNDTLRIEDPDRFDRNLIKKSESFNCETSSDVARKGPTVYVGDARKMKTYRK